MTLAVIDAWANEHERPSQRAIEMGILYSRGRTMQEIGEQYGLSRQRVHQLIKPFGLEPHNGQRRREERKRALAEAYGRIVAGGTLTEEAERLGYASSHSLRTALAELDMRIVSRRPPAEHGTLSKYRAGCHCEECRQAQREYMYAYRRNRGEPPQHGTASGYNNFACRCPECKGAMRLYRRELRARERQRQPTDA